jgi:hypothetical protein
VRVLSQSRIREVKRSLEERGIRYRDRKAAREQ